MDNNNIINTGNPEEIQGQPVPEPAEKPVEQITIKKNSELYMMLSEYLGKVIHNTFLRKLVVVTLVTLSVLLSALIIFVFFVYAVPAIQEIHGRGKQLMTNNPELRADKAYKSKINALVKEVQKLSRKYSAYTPGQSYLVINTTDNRFVLYKNKKQVREGFCSSGSYTHLTTAEGTRHWIFKTPKGKFWIQQKITKPLWKRPDWSFVEEGLPIPPPDDDSRYEFGVLGDYAMSLGDGYLIHGTIYKRFLGMPVTHGCVRLNDEDLDAIFHTLNLGSKVYIF